MNWSKSDSMPNDWDRKSRKNVTYASRARLEMILEKIKQ